jgi:serine/threonine-protein kinase
VKSGDTISRYRIVRQIGKGGMGVVYQAEDTRLDRPVALKFLPAESFEDRDRERFLNEARAAARIRHPNVCPIYDVEESDGKIFIVMAYLEGETLARKIARGPIELQEAIRIGLQIASGLEKAHELGIVHRDVKSGNILICPDGQVSILDFGLALLPGATRLTAAGFSSGTPAYMSPEQARAENVDHRTDIWSLGVVLFEMATGVLPFQGKQPVAVAHSIVYDAAPPVSSLRPVPPALEKAIGKALEKSPGDRWQRARDLATELQQSQETPSAESRSITTTIPSFSGKPRRWRTLQLAAVCVLAVAAAAGAWYLQRHRLPADSPATVRSATGPKQVAVLPFQVSGSSDKAGIVADGLVEVITEALSDFQRFEGKVMAVPAVEIRRREISTVADARRIYGVDLAVTGSAKSQGNRIHFSLQLTDAARSEQIGTSTFEYDPASPREAARRAVDAVARMLDLTPAPQVREQPTTGDSATPDTYSAYLEGRGLLSRYDVKGNLDKAITSLRRAVTLDPKFALAWAGLGEAYWRQARNNGEKQTADLAMECAQRAVQLGPDLVIVHTVLGTIYGTAGRNDDAIRELQIALKLGPGNAEAPRELARIYTNLGRLQEAEASYLQAVKARPTDWYAHLLLGIFYNGRERYGEAENAFKRALELAPDNEIAARNLGGLYTAEGRYPEAIDVLLKSLKVRQNARTYGTLAATYFYQHRFQNAATAMETAVDLDSSRYEYWGNLGIYYKWIPGAEARTIPALRRAIELAEKRLEVTPTDYGIRADLAEYRARLGDAKAALAEIGHIPGAARQELAGRLAIAYELTGNRSKAIELIGPTLTNRASLNQIKDDPDLARLWADPLFQEAIRKTLRR